MSSYRQIFYHLVFRTKDSRKTIIPAHSRELYAFIMGIIRNKNCKLYRINGTEDHIHMFCDLHPSIALADYMRDIKASTSLWIKQSGMFPDFNGWGNGYAALTYGCRDKEMIVTYIKNQQSHHEIESYEDELRRLLEENEVEVDERYFP